MTLWQEITGQDDSTTCHPREATIGEHIEEMLGGEVNLCEKPKTLIDDIMDIFEEDS